MTARCSLSAGVSRRQRVPESSVADGWLLVPTARRRRSRRSPLLPGPPIQLSTPPTDLQ